MNEAFAGDRQLEDGCSAIWQHSSYQQHLMLMHVLRPSALVIAGAICLGISACNSARQAPAAPNVNDAASTMVALTFQAATRSSPGGTPTARPITAETPSLEKPRLYINVDVKCRTGTNSSSKVVASFAPGATLDMVGKSTAEGAWLVQVPNSAVTCWVRALDSSPAGSFQGLPEATPEPATGQLPSAPTDLSWPFFCSYKSGILYTITIELSWMHTANDANGFRVYRQDTVIADLPPDVTTFKDTADVVLGSELTYSVEAYNDTGASPRLAHTFSSACK